jgi:hypothetical protein
MKLVQLRTPKELSGEQVLAESGFALPSSVAPSFGDRHYRTGSMPLLSAHVGFNPGIGRPKRARSEVPAFR